MNFEHENKIFSSPFAGGKYWSHEVPSTKKDKKLLTQTTVRDLKIAKLLSELKFLTGVQLSQVFFAHNPRTGKKRYNLLARAGLIEKSLLKIMNPEDEKNPFWIPVYFKNDLQGYKIQQILRILVANQFYINMKRVGVAENFQLAPDNIITAKLTYNNVDFYLAIPRNYQIDIKNLYHEIKWAKDKKVLIIAPDLHVLSDIADNLKNTVRYTTDHNIFRKPLTHAFFKFNDESENSNSKLAPVEIKFFKAIQEKGTTFNRKKTTG